MRFASAVIALLAGSCLLCIITTSCSAQSVAPSFQSVSGEFARTWITSNKAQISQPVQESPGNGSDLWNWGKAPKGSKIENGKLLTDPYYLRPLLNLSSNWLGDTYTDPGTGLPVQIYLDPLTGKTTYTYLDPNSGRSIFSYSSYRDAKTGEMVYAYTDPMTGNAISSGDVPINIINSIMNGLAQQSDTNPNGPWTRL